MGEAEKMICESFHSFEAFLSFFLVMQRTSWEYLVMEEEALWQQYEHAFLSFFLVMWQQYEQAEMMTHRLMNPKDATLLFVEEAEKIMHLSPN